MGAEPRFDGLGRLAGARLLPLETLGRPRIDVVASLSACSATSSRCRSA
jgi:magnesium chelatase subunit H